MLKSLAEDIDLVVTRAEEHCPIMPRAVKRFVMAPADPAAALDDELLEAFGPTTS